MRFAILILLLSLPLSAPAAEPTPAERGKKALLETSYIPPAWRQPAYDSVWKRWEGVNEKPMMEQHPGVQVLGFQFVLHPLEGGDIDLEVGHATNSVGRLNHSCRRGANHIGLAELGLSRGGRYQRICRWTRDPFSSSPFPARNGYHVDQFAGTCQAGSSSP